uniref:sensor histidine kinase n=1 Tax=Treponema sp. TaxID=166 RepID=UPI00298DC663
VAHEIKNPLGAISIHIQLLQKAIAKARNSDNQIPDEKFVEKYIGVVNEEIDNLNKIVVDFLFAVRPVSANLELLHPNQIIQKLVEFLRPEYQKEKIALEVSLCPQDVRLLIDEKLFREIIVNLSQNAIYAIKEAERGSGGNSASLDDRTARDNGDSTGERTGKLAIISVIKDDKYILTVTDNGCGMSEEKLSKIFEPYYTTKATGTGLGLTTVYKIVKEFSGDIDVKSEEGEGTQFIISIPVPQLNKKLIEYSDSKNKSGEK